MAQVAMSNVGQMFVLEGDLYYIIDDRRAFNCMANLIKDTSGYNEYKYMGFCIDISVPYKQQQPFLECAAQFWELKYKNVSNQNNNIIVDVIKTIQSSLWSVVDSKYAGMKKNVVISKAAGKSTFQSAQTKLRQCEIVTEWTEFATNVISMPLSQSSIKKLLGKKKLSNGTFKIYPLIIGEEEISLDEVRLIWNGKEDHIFYQRFTIECHVISKNTDTKRIIGSVADKKNKIKSKRMRKRMAKMRLSFKPGQIYAQPTLRKHKKTFASRKYFYLALFQEDDTNIMAISFLLYFGCLDVQLAERLYNQYKQQLLKPAMFDVIE